MREQIYFLWLADKYPAGSDMFKRLFEKFDTVEDIYYAEKQDFLNAGFLSREIYPLLSRSLEKAQRVDEYCYKNRIGIAVWGDPNYPSYLCDINDPPVVLFYRGYLPNLDDSVAVTMVGTRSASDMGIKTAHRLSFDIATGGGIVVSGMARGIDAACHRGALDAGGTTIALLGSGIDIVYPPEHGALYDSIRENGAVISEYFPETPPLGTNFPVRNRLLSAFSRSTVIVEAPVGSGALITAKHASSHGKHLFAVPGSPINPSCSGSNMLLRDGVSVALDAYDVLSEYEFQFSHRIFLERIGGKPYYMTGDGVEKDTGVNKNADLITAFSETKVKNPDSLYGDEKKVYEILLQKGFLTAESLVNYGIALDKAVLLLTALQLKEYITALPGGIYSLHAIQE